MGEARLGNGSIFGCQAGWNPLQRGSKGKMTQRGRGGCNRPLFFCQHRFLSSSNYLAEMTFTEAIINIVLNIAATHIDAFVTKNLPKGQRLRLWRASHLVSSKRRYRVSIAYLFRIKLNGKYLLVKGHRIDQFQPVGGVRKWHDSAKSVFQELDVREDGHLTNDKVSYQDLRVNLPARNLLKFLDWYQTQKSREVDQQREFYEELIQPGLLPKEVFSSIKTEYLYTVPTLHFSPHFRCHELLYHEVFELIPSAQQELALLALQNKPSNAYVWVPESLILSLGHDSQLGHKPFHIGEHARLLISKDLRLFND